MMRTPHWQSVCFVNDIHKKPDVVLWKSKHAHGVSEKHCKKTHACNQIKTSFLQCFTDTHMLISNSEKQGGKMTRTNMHHPLHKIKKQNTKWLSVPNGLFPHRKNDRIMQSTKVQGEIRMRISGASLWASCPTNWGERITEWWELESLLPTSRLWRIRTWKVIFVLRNMSCLQSSPRTNGSRELISCHAGGESGKGLSVWYLICSMEAHGGTLQFVKPSFASLPLCTLSPVKQFLKHLSLASTIPSENQSKIFQFLRWEVTSLPFIKWQDSLCLLYLKRRRKQVSMKEGGREQWPECILGDSLAHHSPLFLFCSFTLFLFKYSKCGRREASNGTVESGTPFIHYLRQLP